MKLTRMRGVACCAVLIGALTAPAVSADEMSSQTIIDIAEEGSLYLGIVADPLGQYVQTFTASAAGSVVLTTQDLQIGDLMSALMTSVSLLHGSPPLTMTGPGTLMFDIGRNENFTAGLYALVTSPGPGYGVAGMYITFTPDVTEVPLPAGVWLLASGLALVFRRRRATVLAPMTA